MTRKRRRAGAATPTRRNTTQALDRARRASDVINISNYTGIDNPPRPRPPAVALVRERAGSRLRDALALVDIRVLDHLVIGDGRCMSFAERGLL